MEDMIRVEFNMEQQMCNDCKKSSKEYYELKVQFRFTFFDINIDNSVNNENIVKIKDEVIKLIEKNFKTINKKVELDKGVDFYFRSSGELNKISSLFNKRYLVEEKHSKKVVGRDMSENNDILRHTLLINIINLELKDVISIKGKNYWIKAFNKNDLVLRGVERGEKKVVTYSIIKDYINLVKKNREF